MVHLPHLLSILLVDYRNSCRNHSGDRLSSVLKVTEVKGTVHPEPNPLTLSEKRGAKQQHKSANGNLAELLFIPAVNTVFM